MRNFTTLITVTAALAASPAMAGDPEKPVTDRDITAVDVATTPMNDLNLRKVEIPPQLIAAQAKPYDLAGLNRCGRISAAVGELDAMLGDDIDIVADEKRGPSAGKLAQWFVGSFIPFRGALRELSGANEQRRRMDVAIQAGMARRAFLKGVGETKGCRYPARSATPAVIAALAAAEEEETARIADAKEEKKSSRKNRKDDEPVTVVSQPVVQPVRR